MYVVIEKNAMRYVMEQMITSIIPKIIMLFIPITIIRNETVWKVMWLLASIGMIIDIIIYFVRVLHIMKHRCTKNMSVIYLSNDRCAVLRKMKTDKQLGSKDVNSEYVEKYGMNIARLIADVAGDEELIVSIVDSNGGTK